jgi:hypothetical protein
MAVSSLASPSRMGNWSAGLGRVCRNPKFRSPRSPHSGRRRRALVPARHMALDLLVFARPRPHAGTVPPRLNQMGDVLVGLLPYGFCRLQARTTHGWLCTFGSSPGLYLGDPSPIALARPPPVPRPTKLPARLGTATRREDFHLKRGLGAGSSFAGGTGRVTEDWGLRRR